MWADRDKFIFYVSVHRKAFIIDKLALDKSDWNQLRNINNLMKVIDWITKTSFFLLKHYFI